MPAGPVVKKVYNTPTKAVFLPYEANLVQAQVLSPELDTQGRIYLGDGCYKHAISMLDQEHLTN